jgi:hypothetical protein
MAHVNRDWFILKRTARVCVTALEVLRTTTKSARNLLKFFVTNDEGSDWQ